MPWNHPRAGQSLDQGTRRRSFLGTLRPTLHLIQSNPGEHTTAFDESPTSPTWSAGRGKSRDSVVSLSAVNDTLSFPDTTPPVVPASEEKPRKTHRFSMLRFRHASDPQLSKTAKGLADSADAPPVSLTPPAIITTAPTSENFDIHKRKSAFLIPRQRRSPAPSNSLSTKTSRQSLRKSNGTNGHYQAAPSLPTSRITFDEGVRLPPAYGDESSYALALPINRLSESSRSDGSSGDTGLFATTTTTHTVSTTTTFFRLPRRKKEKGHLFPLPAKVASSDLSPNNRPPSTSGRTSESPIRQSFSYAPRPSNIHGDSPLKAGQSSHAVPAAASLIAFGAAEPGLIRRPSSASVHSNGSASVSGHPPWPGNRGRSSTMSSLRRALDESDLPPPPARDSVRTSTSTTGRPSLGGLFNLSRLRQSAEPLRNGTQPGTPGSGGSKGNSFTLPRESSMVIPERQEGDTPARYLARLEEVVNRGALATLISKNNDEFSKNVMRSFMRRFKFFEDPLDMAVRKLLMHVELPKETQQIDRTLQSFSDRYHECNPGIFDKPDETYFIAFSILILHTDVFNKNNKHKMQKRDYIKNAQGQGCATEILDCFYDNIAYTPFIHVEDDIEIAGDRIIAPKSAKGGFKASKSGSVRRSGSGPVDPYTLILDGKLDTLRPDLSEIITMEEPFNYLGTAGSINMAELRRTFFKSGVIQIVSSRSRPEAFANQATITNPSEGQVGVVDIKITKVGIVWRKDPKKKKARSPWQEWGAILTGSQIYFFRNISWVKSLIHQYETHQKVGRSGTPVVFKPPLEQLKPDFLVAIDGVVALVDSQYHRHKNAFVFARQDVYQEVFLADNEHDLNDWLAKINYASAFRTAGVRMRGVVGGTLEAHRAVKADEANSNGSTNSLPAMNEAQKTEELKRLVMLARRQILTQRIKEMNENISTAESAMEVQLRTARHLKLLSPIQDRTRAEVVEAATRLATHLRWARMDLWRSKCHRDILGMDLEEDIRLGSAAETKSSDDKSSISSPQSKGVFGRIGPRSGNSPGSSNSSRPPNQPSGAKLFSMDDIFRSPSRLISKHRPKSSWELPHLTFDRNGSVSIPGTGPTPIATDDTSTMSGNEATTTASSDIARVATELATPAEQDNNERDLLAEAGIVSPEAETLDVAKTHDLGSEDETLLSPPVDGGGDSLSKVRHSIHRKLQNAHAPSHHRGKKGKDSASSAGISEDSASTKEGEGLTRSTGSFTVHGKKASVITFGSEWQKVSPEERLTMRKAHADDSKLGAPHPMEIDETLMLPQTTDDARPMTPGSYQSETDRSLERFMSSESKSTRPDGSRRPSLSPHANNGADGGIETS